MIALIPARGGSKRIVGKNLKPLAGKPLIAWTIQAALHSGVFARVDVVTDDYGIATWVLQQTAASVVSRSEAGDTQPDIDWVREYLAYHPRANEFCILRPTSPFRSAETIRRAYRQWREQSDCIDSLRAVTPSPITPYKMWVSAGPKGYEAGHPILPLLTGSHHGTPYHSSPTQTLPTVYVQTGGLEMGWTRNVEQLGSISGRKVAPFVVHGPDALDINHPEDWDRAEAIARRAATVVPAVSLAALSPPPDEPTADTPWAV